MASAPSSEADPLSGIGNIVSSSEYEEQTRLFARYEQEKIDRELAERLEGRRSLTPRPPSPRASAAERRPAPIPVVNIESDDDDDEDSESDESSDDSSDDTEDEELREFITGAYDTNGEPQDVLTVEHWRYIANQRVILDRIQAQSAANSRPITPRSPPPRSSAAERRPAPIPVVDIESDADDEEESDSDLSDDHSRRSPPSVEIITLDDDVDTSVNFSVSRFLRSTAGATPPYVFDFGPGPSPIVNNAERVEDEDEEESGSDTMASDEEYEVVEDDEEVDFSEEQKRQNAIAMRWVDMVFKEPDTPSDEPISIKRPRRSSGPSQEQQEKENEEPVARTTDRWGDCTICLAPTPTDPMGCVACLQFVGCRTCCKKWVLSTIASAKVPTCPLCRNEWGKQVEVMSMTEIEERKQKKRN